MNRAKFWPLALTILGSIVLLSQLVDDELPKVDAQLQPSVHNDADYVMMDAQIIHFDVKGVAQSRIAAKQASHYPARRIMRLREPRFEQIYPDKQWQLTAPVGVLDERRQVFILTDGVTFQGQIGADDVNGTIEWLELDLNNKRIHSLATIHLFAPSWEVTGEGLHVAITQQKLKILRNVNAVYQAN